MTIKRNLLKEEDKEDYISSRTSSNMIQGVNDENLRPHEFGSHDSTTRNFSINELTENEIVLAYNKLKTEKFQAAIDEKVKKEGLSSEMKEEFLKWIELRKIDEKTTLQCEKSDETEKVNIIDETENQSDLVNVVNEPKTLDVAPEAVEQASDFDEFKDVISDNEGDEYLKVPLVIQEDDPKEVIETIKREDDELIPTVISAGVSDIPTESQQVTIDAIMTLSNAPLEVKMNLSSSSISLGSDKSGDESVNKKRPVNHTKGRAPKPPVQSVDVIPGHYYDHVTKKHFKETEL